MPYDLFSNFYLSYFNNIFTFRLKPMVESNLREILLMERELSSLLSKGFNEDTEEGIHHCR